MHFVEHEQYLERLALAEVRVEDLPDGIGNHDIHITRIELVAREHLYLARFHVFLDVDDLASVREHADVAVERSRVGLVHAEERIEREHHLVLARTQHPRPLRGRIEADDCHIVLERFLYDHLRADRLTAARRTSDDRVHLEILEIHVRLLVGLGYLADVDIAGSGFRHL